MSDWSIRVPHRSRDESLIDVASHCRHLEGDQGAVMRELVIGAQIDGCRTAGELLDRLGALEPRERRVLLDQARAACDLPSTGDVEALERSSAVAARAGGVQVRDTANSPYQLCHGRAGNGLCNQAPVNSLGVPVAVDVRRWFCEAHRDQAEPGDMDPPPAPWRYSESGAIVENDPAEQARAAAAAESRRAQQEATAADRAVEAAESRAHQDAIAERHNRELPEHLREQAA